MASSLEDRTFELLLELAYLGIDEQLPSQAQTIFEALADNRCDNPHPQIGLALVAYRQQRHNDAIDTLRQVLQRFPAAVFARSLLAMMLKEQRDDAWPRYAHESLALNSHGVAADLARRLLSSEPSSAAALLSINSRGAPRAGPASRT